MYAFTVSFCVNRAKLCSSVLPISSQVRWKKEPKRKPRWLPMAANKMFRIPQHPYVPPDEKQLFDDLLEEYYKNFVSLRKMFQDELEQKNAEKKEAFLLLKQREEEEYKLHLEENKRENERIKIIREETLEKEFQENQLLWLQLAEETKAEREKTKLLVEDIVRQEKEKSKGYVTLQNIDEIIEKALDNPTNPNFTITVDGTIKWEGKPSLEYEADINQRVASGKQ